MEICCISSTRLNKNIAPTLRIKFIAIFLVSTTSMSVPKYVLRYFEGRGKAEPIRLILSYAGQKFEDVRYPRQSTEWLKLKEELRYGQLPVLEIDGQSIPQSIAISRYLANEYGLGGSNNWESLQCDIIVDAVEDIEKTVWAHVSEQDVDKKEEIGKRALARLAIFLRNFEEDVQKNGGHVVGAELTWADFFVVYFSDQLIGWYGAQVIVPYPGITRLRETVRALPGVAEWIRNRPVTTCLSIFFGASEEELLSFEI